MTVPAFITAVASAGTVNATGNVALTNASGTVASGSLTAISSSSWLSTHPPGIYVVDAGNGVQLSITTDNTTYAGYTFVAPDIIVDGSNNTFTSFSTAAQSALFYAYDPNGDAVHVSNNPGNDFTGSIFCGPELRVTPGVDPTNKCWFGGSGTTFTGLMEAWHIEYTATDAFFNGTGPAIGPGTTTTFSTTTFYGTTTISTPDVTVTSTTPATVTGSTYGLDE